jgi:anthranilate synthase/aminodeoxychorismate synthase-like glutamine amidotransferase
MILMIDNYDSFTYNLVQLFGEFGEACEVRRNNALSVESALAMQPDGIVLSPGPCTPSEAGICLDLIRATPSVIPVLGVCLGHQAIAQAYGATVERAITPMHGKVSSVFHQGENIFKGLPSPFDATRYHSLIVSEATLPDFLTVTARANDGVIMGLRHRSLPVFGVQFHPESIACRQGGAIIANFLDCIHEKK